MSAVTLADVTGFLDEYLGIEDAPDYPHALNGLQVAGPERVSSFAVAVDASEAVIAEAGGWADLLIVHHGLFWSGLQPLTGPHFRRVRLLVESGTALYSAHLPLDGHAEVGNAAVLARKLGIEALEPFGEYGGASVGWRGVRAEVPLRELADSLAALTGARVRTLPGGPDPVSRVGVVTGSGADALHEAAAAGLDVLVTGEARHHHAIEAAESGITVLLGGHYATEVWGVRAVAAILEEHFGIEGRFVDSPTGL